MILLSEVSPDEVVGQSVLSLKGKVGCVTDMYYNSRYKKDDTEQNPVITVAWDDDSISMQAHENLNYVTLFCW